MPLDLEKNIFDWIADVSGLQGTRLQLVEFNADSPARSTLVYFAGGTGENQIRPGQFDVMLGIYSRAENWKDARDDCWLVHNGIFDINFVELPAGLPVIQINHVRQMGGPSQVQGNWEQDLRYYYTALYEIMITKI